MNQVEPAGVFAKDLWYIVDSVKANFMIDSNGHDSTFFKWAMDGYRDLTLANVVREAIRTKFLPNPKCDGEPEFSKKEQIRYQLPLDFIDYYTIGIKCRDYVQPLDYNPNIYTGLDIPICDCTGEELNEQFERDRLCSCGNGLGIPGQIPYWEWGWGAFWKNGQFIAGEYGRSAFRYRGAFNIDWGLREIVLDRCTKPHEGIVITYKSNGIGTGNANITDEQVAVLCKYVEFQKVYYETQVKPNREKSKLDFAFVNKAERLWQKEVTRANARRNAMTIEQIHASVLKGIKQTPKR